MLRVTLVLILSLMAVVPVRVLADDVGTCQTDSLPSGRIIQIRLYVLETDNNFVAPPQGELVLHINENGDATADGVFLMPVEDVFSITGRGRVVTFHPVPGSTYVTCAGDNGNGLPPVAHFKFLVAEEVEGEALAVNITPDRPIGESGLYTITLRITDTDGTVLVETGDAVLFAKYPGQE